MAIQQGHKTKQELVHDVVESAVKLQADVFSKCLKCLNGLVLQAPMVVRALSC